MAIPRGRRNDTAMLAKQIGANMKAARKARGLSLERVAERCEPPTSYQQLSRLEKGDRSLTVDWIERVARALGVEPMELIRGRGKVEFALSEQVANEIAGTLALVAREGEPAEPGIVQALSLMLQELTATFLEHPQAYHDPQIARPVISLAGRRYAPAGNSH